MKALFAFTIGPVKAFIENSRKMIDLCGGSSILSNLTSIAIAQIEIKGFEVIFPKGDGSNIPNRLIAKVNNFCTCSMDYYKHIAEEISQIVKDEYKKIYISTFKSIGITEKKDINVASKQMSDFLEVYWIYESYEDDTQYKKAYNDIFSGLHAVKNIRYFTQNNEFWGRKCTLFPEYNAIVIKKDAEGKFPANTNMDKLDSYIDITENLKLTYLVKPKEALSAISLFKRAFMKDKKVKSLRNMLLEAYYYEINNCVEYKTNLNPTDIANAIYDFLNNHNPTSEEYPEDTITTAKTIYESIKENNISLSSYYACIKFDGDNMGDVYRKMASEDSHRNLSKKICDFANLAKTIIEIECNGLCVYAGGEDVLAFLPIHTLFSGLQKLHQAFYDVTNLTFSAGIAIAHLMQPLKEVLLTANKMEHYAKSNVGKNAFALSLIKRNGELRVLRHSFYNGGNKDYKSLRIIDGILHVLSIEKCSKSLIHDINKTLSILDENEDFNLNSNMVQVVIEQIIRHKGLYDKELFDKFINISSVCTHIREYINFLDIVGFLSREVLTNVPN